MDADVKTKVYFAFDERMALHRPPNLTNDQDDPDFVFERPARLIAISKKLMGLEERLMREQFQRMQAAAEKDDDDDDDNEDNDYETLRAVKGGDTLPNTIPCCCLQADRLMYRRFIPLPCTPASRETVCLAHSRDYYQRMTQLPNMSDRDLKRLNGVDSDLYYCRDTFLAASMAVGGCIECVDAVTDPDSKANSGIAVVRPPGHHAEKNHAMGFCFFNNVAIAAKHAIATGRANRVFILDWDIHHGNGIQNLTYDDPNIFYVSIHRGPSQSHKKGSGKKPRRRAQDALSYFYPGTGHVDETGKNEGLGSNLNIAWGREGMGNVEYAAAFAELVLPVMQSFGPDLILVACGLDAAAGDLLGDCGLTPEMYYIMTSSLLQTTGRSIPMVVVLEGGYQLDVISNCMEAVALALLDEPWDGNKTTERDVEQSLSRYWRHEFMQTTSHARRRVSDESLATAATDSAAVAATSSSPSGSTPATALVHAVSSIKEAAQALALSQSSLGAYNCIQSPNGFTCPNCAGHCKKRRMMLLESDLYPMKKQILVRSYKERSHSPSVI